MDNVNCYHRDAYGDGFKVKDLLNNHQADCVFLGT